MTADKNLFLYDLAIVAILKNEENYLKEWLDYHLLAGAEHFYLYNNDSSDDYKEILAPYVENNLVTLTDFPGKLMMYPAYDDAIDKYRFECRYMAFIDIDEFVYPKRLTADIISVVDEILSVVPNAAGLAVHWQCFGSNGQDKADYFRGVLERFTRRGEKNFGVYELRNNRPSAYGNVFLKLIAKPRRIKEMLIHYATYFEGYYSVNERGNKLLETMISPPVFADNIAINHYFTKSREEFDLKRARGRGASVLKWSENYFKLYDCNDVFDDGILKYRAARAENFSLKSDEQRLSRVTNALIKTLSRFANEEISDLETALTCRALSHYLLKKHHDDRFKIFEEASLAAILNSLDGLKIFDVMLLIRELPDLLFLPYPIVAEIKNAALQIILQMMKFQRERKFQKELADLHFLHLNYLRRLLEA